METSSPLDQDKRSEESREKKLINEDKKKKCGYNMHVFARF